MEKRKSGRMKKKYLKVIDREKISTGELDCGEQKIKKRKSACVCVRLSMCVERKKYRGWIGAEKRKRDGKKIT